MRLPFFPKVSTALALLSLDKALAKLRKAAEVHQLEADKLHEKITKAELRHVVAITHRDRAERVASKLEDLLA
jgi:hypothetical protein